MTQDKQEPKFYENDAACRICGRAFTCDSTDCTRRFGSYRKQIAERNQYIAALQQRVKELEERNITMAEKLDEKFEADGYYRGFNAGYDEANRQRDEALESQLKPSERELLKLTREGFGDFHIWADGELVETVVADKQTYQHLLPLKLWRQFNNLLEKRVKAPASQKGETK